MSIAYFLPSDVIKNKQTDKVTTLKYIFKGRVERIFFFASFKLPLFNEYEMVFIIA